MYFYKTTKEYIQKTSLLLNNKFIDKRLIINTLKLKFKIIIFFTFSFTKQQLNRRKQ